MIDKIGRSSYAGANIPVGAKKPAGTESEPIRDSFISSDKEPPVEKEWTILAYMCGSNDLKEQITGNLKEFEETGSTDNAHVVAYVSRDDYSTPLDRLSSVFKNQKPSRVSDSWKGSRIYHIQQGDRNSPQISSTLIEDRGRERVNNPDVLEQFIKMGMEKFPAKHYMVILSGHGAGPEGALVDKDRKPMPLASIEKALTNAQQETGKKIDVLGLDACQMGQVEVAYQFKDAAGYLVASPGRTYGESYDYGPLMKGIKEAADNKVEISPERMAWGMVHVSEGFGDDVPVLTAIDLSRMPQVKDSLDSLAEALKNTGTPAETINQLILQSPQHDESLYDKAKQLKNSGSEVNAENLYRPTSGSSVRNIDILGFCSRILNSGDISDKSLKAAATNVKEAIGNATVNKQVYFGNAEDLGLSIHLPAGPDGMKKPDKNYDNLAMSKDGQWNGFLKDSGHKG